MRFFIAIHLLVAVACDNDFTAVARRPFGAGELVLGEYYTLAVRDDGSYGWGINSQHQLGPGEENVLSPVILTDYDVETLAAGSAHTCVTSRDGVVSCMGINTRGQLGVGDLDARASLTPVALPSAAVSVTANYLSSCALLDDARLYCWGYNGENALSQSKLFADVLTPAPVSAQGNNAWRDVSLGDGHMCAIDVQGGLWCSGRNANGQCGADNAKGQLGRLTRVGDSTDWSAIAATQSSTCGLRGAALYCWGVNNAGQLGNGSLASTFTPTSVGGTWTQLAVGALSTCALDDGGALWCWGRNFEGQLGLGESMDNVLLPTLTLENVTRVSVGRFHTCAIDERRALDCVGQNTFGQLGFGDTLTRRAWTPLAPP